MSASFIRIVIVWLAFLALGAVKPCDHRVQIQGLVVSVWVLESLKLVVKFPQNDVDVKRVASSVSNLKSLVQALSLVVNYIYISTRLKGIHSVEDVEIDRQLKILNKPYIKSIETEEGDIFDCVDIYKQPAFDHPLLKNHTIQMKPSGFPKKVVNATSPAGRSSAQGLREGCPFGTVPIKRVGKEELIASKMFMEKQNSHPTDISFAAFHYATRILASSAGRQYLGATAEINVQNPLVTDNQFSQAFVQIKSGPGVAVNTIQFGWMVYPKIFGDNKTRTFASWTADKNGCFNIFCSGFIQVNPTYPLGYVLNKISNYGSKDQYVIQCNIFKDPKSGNWWVAYDNLEETIGYWPNSLFTSLSSSASEISWGGGVYSDSNEASPPMGNGHFAEEGYEKAAYFRDIQIIDESNKMVFPVENLLHFFTDSPKCYSIAAFDTRQAHHAFLYGGPGGSCAE
ncbi:protein neprosin-like [Corylus avellana]|uniref:protein neprosin-like n=1 Tax=Corylus avellana TaxID=13451 RepID=UPI001E1F2FC9|nr:protein neprosin-like [Corylus avellana]